MKNLSKILTFTFLGLVMLISSCMKEMPYVKVIASKWDDVSNSWVQLQEAEKANINDKTYVYGQKFLGTVQGDSFTVEIGLVDENDSTKGQMIRTYTFDGKTWSYDSTIGAQTPIDGTPVLKDSINHLYAYYAPSDAPANSFEFSWELVDSSQVLYEKDVAIKQFYRNSSNAWTNKQYTTVRDSELNKSVNASLTKGMPPVVSGKGRTVNAPIPTRRGYKFIGWTDISNVEYNPDNYDVYQSYYYPKFAKYPAKSTFSLDFKHGYVAGQEEKKTILYAVWEPDYDNGYWATIENKYVPNVFDFDDHIRIGSEIGLNNTYATSLNYLRYYGKNINSVAPYKEVHFPTKGLTVPFNMNTNDNINTPHTFEYDFAMAEQEFFVYTLYKLHEWNDENIAELKYELPTLSNGKNTALPVANTDTSNVIIGGAFRNGELYQTDDRYSYTLAMPVTYTLYAHCIVICNAMTAYHNDHNGSAKDLTFAYRKDDGNPVRTIAEATTFVNAKTSTLPQYGCYADILATGYRLPTIQEAKFAMAVVPMSNYCVARNNTATVLRDSDFQGSSYPQFQPSWLISGTTSRGRTFYDNTEGPSESFASDYIFTQYSSSVNSTRTNGSIRGYAAPYHINTTFATSIDKDWNAAGLNNLSGNVMEASDSPYQAGSTRNSIYGASSTDHGPATAHISYVGSLPINTRYPYQGFRTVRTINHLK